MSRLYAAEHRALQDSHDTRRLADLIEQVAVHTTIGQEDRRFIESRDMFYLSTIDARGFPTVSYKGGDAGFIRVLDEQTLAFPIYDGNGMYFSAGNLTVNPKVGLLFIDFETPNRLRAHGTASIDANDPLLMAYVEADLIVRVRVEELFPNCPRYVHRYRKVDASKYVPRDACATPLVSWKRIDLVQPALPARDRGKAEPAGGLITIDDYFAKVKAGDA
ncbi:MAG: pyridoxamine 5'-phosphate oxidase family protein [Burkholderiales bacterium]|nr:pyridoxamine 5'-phosphate oxidase family protein [Burkholderiales bacterium]